MQSINPFTGKLLATFEPDSDELVDFKINQAQSAFEKWKNTSFEERRKLLKKVAKHLRKDKECFALLITQEMGKLISESRAEVEKCALVCDYYAENGEKFLQDDTLITDASQSFITYQPLGVILAVMPWNFPFWQVFRFVAPALMAGNVCVLKHASNVPQCALAIQSIFKECAPNKKIVQTLLIPAHKVDKVLENPIIKAATLTGSEDAGSKVAQTAGKHLKKTVLELGGSDIFIVLEDANLDLAIKTAVKSRMINCGQSCIAAKRFIVQESIYELFVEKLTEAVSQLRFGDPNSENTDFSVMAKEELAIDLKNQVQKSILQGAKLILGGEQEGAYFEPAILTDVEPQMTAFSEELFGPVFAIGKFKSVDEAIGIANNSMFGLGGSIWTKNSDLGIEIAKKIETGAVFVNGLVKSDPRLPFGGIKNSGYGRELSYLGIREFTNAKTVWVG